MRFPPATLHFFTDSSLTGFGAHMSGLEMSGLWSGQILSWHINRFELEAVVRAIFHWENSFTNQVVLISTDNTTVISHINKQRGGVGEVDQVRVTMQASCQPPSVMRPQKCNYPSQTLRAPKCASRYVIEKRPIPPIRIVSLSRYSRAYDYVLYGTQYKSTYSPQIGTTNCPLTYPRS